MKKILLLMLALMALALVRPSFAADIARDVRTGGATSDYSDGGYFEIGASIEYYRTPFLSEITGTATNDGEGLSLILAGEYRYKGLFVEAAQGTSDGLNIGYNFWRNNNWVFDFLALSGDLILGEDGVDLDYAELSEEERNIVLVDNYRIHQGTGFRATRYFNNYIFQFRLLADVANNHGILSTARIGKSWQLRNWNLHTILTFQYTSAKANQHFYGVREDQATSLFPEYKASSAVSYVAEIGATYPVSENWVFRSTAKLHFLPSETKKSPLAIDDNISILSLSLSYVF